MASPMESRMPKPCEHQRLTDDSLVGPPALLMRVAVSEGEIVLFGMAPVSSMPNRAAVFRRGCEKIVYTNAQGLFD
jgi:hypothetical protein